VSKLDHINFFRFDLELMTSLWY